jgi:hypothetical protein
MVGTKIQRLAHVLIAFGDVTELALRQVVGRSAIFPCPSGVEKQYLGA